MSNELSSVVHYTAEDWWGSVSDGAPCEWSDVEDLTEDDVAGSGHDLAWWHGVVTDARAIESFLGQAARAWERGDTEVCRQALMAARAIELRYTSVAIATEKLEAGLREIAHEARVLVCF